MNQNKTSFAVTYTGPAVEYGEMDVRLLIRTLTNLNEYLEYAAQVDSKEDRTISLRLEGPPKEGSYELWFLVDLVQPILDYGVQVGQEVVDAALSVSENVEDLAPYERSRLGRLLKAIFDTIRYVIKERGVRMPLQRSDDTDRTQAKKVLYRSEITGIIVSMSKEGAQLYEDPVAMKKLTTFLSAARKRGIDAITIRTGEEFVHVTSEEVRFFYRFLRQQPEVEEQRRTKVIVMSPYFDERRKWKLAIETPPGVARDIFSAAILDKRFLRRVRNREIAFGRGDMLDVTLRVRRPELVDVEIVAKHPKEKRDVLIVHNYIKATT